MYVIDVSNKEVKHSETFRLQASHVSCYLQICVFLTERHTLCKHLSTKKQTVVGARIEWKECYRLLSTWCSKNIFRRKRVFEKHIIRMIRFPTALSNLPLLALGNGKMRYIVEYWHVNNARMFDSPKRYTEVEHFMKKNVDYKRW